METSYIDYLQFRKALKSASQLLEIMKEEVNELNVFPVPDGDTGTNMSLTMNSAVKNSLDIKEKNVSKIALAASHGSLMGARGNSGVILSQLFRGFALGLNNAEYIDVHSLANAFKQASETAYNAVMKPTEGTILTVARECGEYASRNYRNKDNILDFFKEIIDHGNNVLNKTPDMLPVLKQAGVVDAGGKGLMVILEGAYESLTGMDIKKGQNNLLESDEEEKFEKLVRHEEMDIKEIKYSYCTEFMIYGNIEENRIDKFREELSEKGDSLMVVQGEGIVKVHVHTNNPGLALEKALSLGSLTDIKIDNMKFQHEKLVEKTKNNDSKQKKYSIVSISSGHGIDEIFKSLNVDEVVKGGQTMNPSTEDIAKAIEKTSGKNVFILPNNSNIILAAEQAKELVDRNVIVIPSRNIPQGISALFEFNEESSLQENKKNMEEAIKNIKSGQITYAVRDSEFDGKIISKDDILGIKEGDIHLVGKEYNQVLFQLIEDMIDEDSSLISIIYGEEITEDEAKKLENQLISKYDDLDIEVVYGGQPIYYYIFSVE